MYKILVRDPDDVLAALAYTAYKQHEAEVLEAWESSGVEITPARLAEFHVMASVDSQLEKYEARAQELMNAFLEETLGARKNQLEKEFATTKMGVEVHEILRKLREPRTFYGWLADIGGNLAVMFGTILLVAALAFGYGNIDSVLGALWKKTGITKEEPGKQGEKAPDAPAASAEQHSGAAGAEGKGSAPQGGAKTGAKPN